MLHACGIVSFLTPLPTSTAAAAAACGSSKDALPSQEHQFSAPWSATGEVKVTPEDFVVVEMDTSGQRTDADLYAFPHAEALEASSLQTEGVKEIAGGAAEGEGEDVNGNSAAHTLDDLRCLVADQAPLLRSAFGTAADIGSTAMTSLTPLSMTALLNDVQLSAQGPLPHKDIATSRTGASSAPHWWRGSHRLGDFTDKRERQLVHLLVRRCFPHLRTFAEPSTSASAFAASQLSASAASCTSLPDSVAAASVMVCAIDLHFVLFCATLGTEAALCIAQWAVAAQAARQERSLDEATREVLRAVTPVEDGAMPTAVQKGVCFASFDALSEAMQRPCGGDHSDLNVSVLSEKDVRRHVHELLRRFYPFLRCQVREGQVVLRYCPRPGPTCASGSPTASSNSSGSSSNGGVVMGVRRPREEEGEGGAETSSRLDSGFLHIIVTKRNLDTAEMRQLIGEYCGVKDSAVCIAGMKDKKAVTTQRCSLPLAGVSAKAGSALAAATPSLPVTLRWPADPLNSYAMVTRASPRRGPLHLGQLKGNWFSIRVRNVRWSALSDSTTTQPSHECGDPQKHADALRAFITERFHCCVAHGFVNYFGQQRFGETIDRADDHTGVHLFAGRWVEAVRSLYRGCPDVYDAFPEKMEVRFVPNNSRDAQVMTHALRQTQRMFFSEHSLTRQDVQSSSPLWTRLCEKAITEGVAYFLRSLWVHAGQSVFFNLTASFLIASVQSTPPADLADAPSLPPLPAAVVEKAQLPLGGYQVHRTPPESEGDEATHALWCAWRDQAIQHALRTLRWTSAQAFEQRKVAGVPVPGSWRAVVVQPQDAALSWEAEPPQREGEGREPANVPAAPAEMAPPSLRLSFALPSSSYATIFLREVLGCDAWW